MPIEARSQVGPRTSLAQTEMVCTGCIHLKAQIDRPARLDEAAIWRYECGRPGMDDSYIATCSHSQPECPDWCPERKSNKQEGK